MDNIKWVEKARSRDKWGRESLQLLANIDGRVVACDGFRLHAWTGKADITTPEGYPDAMVVIDEAKAGQTTIIISKYHLMQACKAIRALDKKTTTIELRVADMLHCEGHDAWVGTVRVYIKDGDNWCGKSTKVKYPLGRPHIACYARQGPELRIALNPRYLLDALRGMEDIVTITFEDQHSPIYIQSDHKEAVVMPMHLRNK